MKRTVRILALLLAVCTLFAFTGCSGGSSNTPQPSQAAANVDVAALAKSLVDAGIFEDQLSAVDSDKTLKLYSVDQTAVKNVVNYIGTGATPEEVSVWEANTTNDVKTIQDACNARIAAQKKGFTDYNPEQMPKLEAAVLKTSGNYVVLCISNDAAKATSIIDAALK